MRAYWEDVHENGFALVRKLLGQAEVERLTQAIENVKERDGVRRRAGVYAIRNLLELVPEVAELATRAEVLDLARKVLGPHALPVKGTLFDKTADANWLVPWHQDLTIAVKDRVHAEGYGPWTVKAGVVHVQPPISILEQMLAIRIHLDQCGERNGLLRVLPGTHRSGRLSPERISAAQTEVTPVNCAVDRGGALLMKPLLLHASPAAVEPGHRRVIHIDFAAAELADGLSWFADRDSEIGITQ